MRLEEVKTAIGEDRKHFEEILRTIPSGVVVVAPDGEFRYANDRAEALLGLQPDEDGRYQSYEELPIDARAPDGTPLPEDERPYHRVTRHGTTVDTEVGIVTAAGEERWLGVHGAPLTNDAGEVTGSVFSFEDVTERVRRNRRLEHLNEFGRRLSETTTVEDACAHGLDAARDILGLQYSRIELYDADTGDLDAAAQTDAVTELLGSAEITERDRETIWEVFVENTPRHITDIAGETSFDPEEVPLTSVLLLPIEAHGVFIIAATSADTFTEEIRTLAAILVSNLESVFERLGREKSLSARNRELEERTSQLERVERVNRLIRETSQGLRDASGKNEIKRVVCETLTGSGPYRFAWFGETAFDSDEVHVAASAGIGRGYLDAIELSADRAEETGQGPVGRALRSREVQVQNNLQADPPFEPWRQEAMRRGYRSCIAVPVLHNDTLYGAVALYAESSGVFSDMEAAVLGELGEIVGYAMSSMERYEAFVSRSSVELEFRITDFSDPLLGLLKETGGEMRLENIGGRTESTIRTFLTFTGVPVTELRRFFRSRFGVEVTLVRDRESETLLEVELPLESFIGRLLERGAMPTSVTGSPEEGRITIRVSSSASVRDFYDLVSDEFEGAELVAKRTLPEPVRTEEEFRRTYVDRLTERQEEVLRTAYFAGFFEQPRDSSSRDIAEMLGVSQPTVSRHIRAGEKKLFRLLFEP